MEATVALPKGIGGINFGELLKLVGLPSQRERAEKHLAETAEVVRPIVSIIDGLIMRTIEKRSAQDFESARDEVFPQYFAAMRALGDLARIVVPKHTMDRVIAESFSGLEADFREFGLSAFGADIRDRGIFTVWTLRKINDLAQEIIPLDSSKDKDGNDAKIAMKFALYAIWTRFHVDCLVKSMRTKQPIYPEVLEPIRDGLRAVVDAYAWIRQAVDLRIGATEQCNAAWWAPSGILPRFPPTQPRSTSADSHEADR